jgi:mannose-1-phosphate guanylyltransferase/mannose-6-phosphate isomerase
MLQATVSRLRAFEKSIAAPMVLCNEEYRFMVAEQLRDLGLKDLRIILEPEGRNTAPAACVASLEALKNDEQSMVLILPADHLVQDARAFAQAVSTGVQLAEQGKLVTFGIVPSKAESGYGYIKQGQRIEEVEEGDGYLVDAFFEKPNPATAEAYLESGEYVWNSGMFLFPAQEFVRSLQEYEPEMVSCCQKALSGAVRDLDFIRLEAESFLSCPKDSIDYAVMERTSNAAVVAMQVGWSDIGSWSALWEVGNQDEQGNVVKGDVLLKDVSGSYIHATNRLVAAVGVKDSVIVETSDAILVAGQGHVQEVKSLVKSLEDNGRDEAKTHSRVYRPWGSYETMDLAERFQVKRITVKPGEVLSLQKHHHRAEHWIVVKGTALVTRGDQEILLSEDESTYIPLGTVHRLQNPGKIPLELIEVQTGSYLGEDDIVRLEDVYGRNKN